MIMGGIFTGIFGSPSSTEPLTREVLTTVARTAVRAGITVVLAEPGGKAPVCTLSDRDRRKDHPCGIRHACDDVKELDRALRVLAKRWPDSVPNLGVVPGPSGYVCIDVDTPEQLGAFQKRWEDETGLSAPSLTVTSPGGSGHHGGGHLWLALPEYYALPEHSGLHVDPTGWTAKWRDGHVLVPPSERLEGRYVVASQAPDAPPWVLDMLADLDEAASVKAKLTADRRADRAARQARGELNTTVDDWAASMAWTDVLGDDWTPAGHDSCGCEVFTAPGEHASRRSATAHVACAMGGADATGRLHVWTDAVPEWMAMRGAGNVPGAVGRSWTKLAIVAARDHGGLTSSAMGALGLGSMGFDQPPGRGTGSAGATGVVRDDPGDGAGPQLVLTAATDIEPRRSRWLWRVPVDAADDVFDAPGTRDEHWVPLGGFSLLAGREGVGKSTVAFELAAQITRGVLPGEFLGSPRTVLVAAAEDDWATTIIPRLLAADADLKRIMKVEVHEDEHVRGLVLPVDMDRLRNVCADPDVVMILVDPLMSVLSGRIDSHKDHDVRVALDPIAALAGDTMTTVLGLIHFNKSSGSDVLNKVMASRAFSAVARAVLVAARDGRDDGAEDTDDDGPARRRPRTFVLGQAKSNLGPMVESMAGYTLGSVRVGTEEGHPIVGSRVVWGARVDGDLSDVVDPDSKPTSGATATAVGAAIEFLKRYLAGRGPVDSSDVRAAAEESGHAWTTVKRARERSDVLVTRTRTAPPRIMWELPGTA